MSKGTQVLRLLSSDISQPGIIGGAWHCDSGDGSLSVFCWNSIHWLVKEKGAESFKLNQKLLKLSKKNGDMLMDLSFIEQGKVLCGICYLGRREQPGFSQLSWIWLIEPGSDLSEKP